MAIQYDRPILTLTASFERPEAGLSHQAAMPGVPPPETRRPDREALIRDADRLPEEYVRSLSRLRPIELRSVEPRALLDPAVRSPRYAGWFRIVAPLAATAEVHRAILAYATESTWAGGGGDSIAGRYSTARAG